MEFMASLAERWLIEILPRKVRRKRILVIFRIHKSSTILMVSFSLKRSLGISGDSA